MRKIAIRFCLGMVLLIRVANPIPTQAQNVMEEVFLGWYSLYGDSTPAWWANWDVDLPGNKDSILSSIGLCPCGSNYHFTDFSGDGVPDLIYSGNNWDLLAEDGCNGHGGVSGGMTVFFENRGDTLTRVFSERGYAVWMSRGTPLGPVREVVVRTDGCCGDLDSHITFYRPADDASLRFESSDSITLRDSGQWPDRMFDRPKAFAVRQEEYNLRMSPEVLDLVEYGEEFLASYGRGATGVAIGERADSTGRIWWFVVMDRKSVPLKRWIRGVDGRGIGRLAGWMSSRFLDVIETAPARVEWLRP